MYPDNPNLLEDYVWTKVDEINREARNAHRPPRPPAINLTIKTLVVIPILVIALATLLIIAL